MKRIPYGISDYEELISENYYYVDKTKYLGDIENAGKRIIYLRPRRFGTTLFTSMMYYYYDINSKEKFDSLFKDTYIYNNTTDSKNSYYVLKFDFSGITGNNEEDLENAFKSKVLEYIYKFISYYNLDISINEDNKVYSILNQFLSRFSQLQLENKLYIIIDEYDNFTNTILSKDYNKFKNMLGDAGFVKAFYSILKENSGSVIDRIFITGVCSISLDAMTSGFNIGTNITNYNKYNSMTALTHDEVKILIDSIDIDYKDKVYNIMVENYDGYRFSDKEELVFNPTLTMYYLNYYINEGHAPQELLDKNIISSYTQIRNILRLQNNNYYGIIITNLINNNREYGILKSNFTLDSMLEKDDIVSLLYYFGYITIEEYIDKEFSYRIPNKVIRDLFIECFNNILNEEYSINNELYEIQEDLILGNIDKLSNEISEILKYSSNRTFIKLNEKDIGLLYFSILHKTNLFNVYNEFEASNGYMDIIAYKRVRAEYDILIELKYIKVDDYNEDLLNERIKEANNQITKYIEDKRIDKSNLKKYIVIFIGSEYKIVEV